MLAHRLRRWPNIKPTLFQRFVFATAPQKMSGQRWVTVCDAAPTLVECKFDIKCTYHVNLHVISHNQHIYFILTV